MKNKKEEKYIENPNEKKAMSKKAKRLCIIGAVIAVIVLAAVLISSNSTAIYSSAVYMFMPETIEQPLGDETITFYVTRNDEFDPKKDEKTPLKAYRYYYYDKDGNKVDLDYDGVYEYSGGKFSPGPVFILAANKNFVDFKSNIAKALPFVIAVLIIVGIIIWFFSWSKREDEKKARLYGGNAKKLKNENKNNE